MKPKFIDFYMNIAHQASLMSYARILKVGAVLVKDDNIIGWSYNGTPRGWDNDCELTLPDGTLKTKPEVTHAEEAMLMKVATSHQSTTGATLFCTHSCCMQCARLIYGANIKTFYYQTDYKSSEGIKFLQQCEVEVIKHNS
jgi:dCMP deaminase